MLDFEWQPVFTADTVDDRAVGPFPVSAVTHPFMLYTPGVYSDERLRLVLGVKGPDPRQALQETVNWLWEHGTAAFGGEPWTMGRRVRDVSGHWRQVDDVVDATDRA